MNWRAIPEQMTSGEQTAGRTVRGARAPRGFVVAVAVALLALGGGAAVAGPYTIAEALLDATETGRLATPRFAPVEVRIVDSTTEPHRRDEYGDRILFDAEGPGQLSRLMTTEPAGLLRFYFDGAEAPQWTVPWEFLFEEKYRLLPDGFAVAVEGFAEQRAPLLFAKGLRITVEDGNSAYYAADLHKFPAGTAVQTWWPQCRTPVPGWEQAYAKATRAALNPGEATPRGEIVAEFDVDLFEPGMCNDWVAPRDLLITELRFETHQREPLNAKYVFEFPGVKGTQAIALPALFGHATTANDVAMLLSGWHRGTYYARVPFLVKKGETIAVRESAAQSAEDEAGGLFGSMSVRAVEAMPTIEVRPLSEFLGESSAYAVGPSPHPWAWSYTPRRSPSGVIGSGAETGAIVQIEATAGQWTVSAERGDRIAVEIGPVEGGAQPLEARLHFTPDNGQELEKDFDREVWTERGRNGVVVERTQENESTQTITFRVSRNASWPGGTRKLSISFSGVEKPPAVAPFVSVLRAAPPPSDLGAHREVLPLPTAPPRSQDAFVFPAAKAIAAGRTLARCLEPVSIEPDSRAAIVAMPQRHLENVEAAPYGFRVFPGRHREDVLPPTTVVELDPQRPGERWRLRHPALQGATKIALRFAYTPRGGAVVVRDANGRAIAREELFMNRASVFGRLVVLTLHAQNPDDYITIETDGEAPVSTGDRIGIERLLVLETTSKQLTLPPLKKRPKTD